MKNRLYIGGYLIVAIFVSLYVKPYAVWICVLTALPLFIQLLRRERDIQHLSKSDLQHQSYHHVLDSLFEHNPNAIGIFDQKGYSFGLMQRQRRSSDIRQQNCWRNASVIS